MTMERGEVLWFESRADYSLDELSALSGVPPQVLDDLAGCGALPADGRVMRWRFEAETVVIARAAGRLREHFELDGPGLAVAVSLLRRVRALEASLAAARARTPAQDD